MNSPPDIIGSADILIIDDEPVIQDGCRIALSEKGHGIDACGSVREGGEAVQKKAYELVLLDMKLPDGDGIDLLRRFREAMPRMAVIVMTGYSTVQNAVQAMKLGATDYLTKPFSDEELILSVEKAIAKKRLAEENLALREQLYERLHFTNIIGENPKVREIFEEIRKAAPTESTILIEGESGTGKELFAKAIHAHSRRKAKQFIVVDCSSFSPSLLESELFGHVKGAFTGAIQDKAGIFEVADGGTLFLDEVANLSWEVQGKLLRVMETQEYKPVGASHTRKTNIRIVAATNQNLKKLVDERLFRKDLFYRLDVLPIYLPPLRERKDDIPKLAYHFLRISCREMNRRIQGFSDDALQMLTGYEWPGNVRQLKNVVERLVIMADETILDHHLILNHLQPAASEGIETIPKTLEELKQVKHHLLEKTYAPIEKTFLEHALTACDGVIARAARRVGMQRSNFSALMKKHNMSASKSGRSRDS